jgi:hypothetical protein
VTEVDKVVQHNAGCAEELAASSEELSSQAGQMKGFVSELTSLVGSSNGTVNISKTASTTWQEVRKNPKQVLLHGSSARKKQGNGQARRGNGRTPAYSGEKPLRPEVAIELNDF